ncbi:MAG: hypothetical protein IJ793_03465, partial [Opitutales bacterium]|nr:hypothetical protein [Opitutales bacterium]
MSEVDQKDNVPPVKAVDEDPASEPKPTTEGLETPDNTDNKDVKPGNTETKESAKDGKNKTPDTLTIIRDEPGNADGAKKFVLRVLSGPHAGAEVDIGAQPSLLGKADSCDIVLIDDALREQHVKFSVKDDKIICTPQDGASVFVGGIETHEEREVNAFQPIVCGTTLLALGPKDQIWPTISVPELKSEADEAEAQEKAKAEAEADLKKKKRRKQLLFFLLIGGTGLLCLVLIGTVTRVSQKKEAKRLAIEESSFPIVALRESIEEVLDKHKVDTELVKISLSGKRFVLSCHVATSREKQELEKELHQLPK